MRLDRRLKALTVTIATLVALTGLAALVSALQEPARALAAVALVVALFLVARALSMRVPRGTVIEVDLDQGVVEELPAGPLGRVTRRGAVVLRDVVDALNRAADDDRIVGLVARLGNGQLGIGHAQELRAAIDLFRASGKRTVAFAESFGESGLATVDYYLASGFEEIHLQPNGFLSVEGVVARVPFLRNLLDRGGVVPDLDHRREYKSAKYIFTEEGFTTPHEEETRAVLEDQFEEMVSGIAAGRGLEQGRVRELIDRAPLLGSEALDEGLVDQLSYRDEAYESARADGKRFLFMQRYLRRAGRPHRRGTRVALILGTGMIHRGNPRFDPLSRGSSFGVDEVAAAFRDAAKDKKVKAIVFRVDSPGGSAVASEIIRREVVRARERGKPVVVSMGNIAGSGGYLVSVSADRIVAQPGTLTGSIGVVAGKLATGQAWRRLGINWDELHQGRNATFMVPDEPYTDSERERLQAGIDSLYQDFKDRVAEGRSLTPEEVEEGARGRVWSGRRAVELGLVDELGGLDRAVELAKELAGIPPDRHIELRVFPRERAVPLLERKESSELATFLLDAMDRVVGRSQAPAVQAVMPFYWPR